MSGDGTAAEAGEYSHERVNELIDRIVDLARETGATSLLELHDACNCVARATADMIARRVIDASEGARPVGEDGEGRLVLADAPGDGDSAATSG